MISSEQPVLFDCNGEQLLGIAHLPDVPGSRGVVIVVGGPQYRVGSHRQFLLLARYLASRGTPVLRFDCRGMGDSDGEQVTFEDSAPDIRASVDALFERMPHLDDVVIWGLCDAASAAMMYGHLDPRVSGMVLVNPWVRTDETLAKTYLKHYYLQRLFNRKFWQEMFAGKVNLARSFSDLAVSAVRAVKLAFSSGKDMQSSTQRAAFPIRMREGLKVFSGRVLFIISGNDLTAAEFRDLTASSDSWQELLKRPLLQWTDFALANHTFSRKEWRDQVAAWTDEWIRSW